MAESSKVRPFSFASVPRQKALILRQFRHVRDTIGWSCGWQSRSAKHASDADAFGAFDGSDYAKALYAAGWPKGVRLYQARHSVALELGERGIDIGDVSGFLGHAQVQTTRNFYAPLASARLKGASDVLAGRFSGWTPVVTAPTADGVH